MEAVTYPLINWLQEFPPEDYLQHTVKNYILNVGFSCPNCSYRFHSWKRGKQLFQCRSCGSRKSLKAFSPFPGSKLPFRVWFMGLCIIYNQPEIGATKLQEVLQLKRYQTAWNIHFELKAKLTRCGHKEPFKLCGYDQVLFLLLEVLWNPIKAEAASASRREMTDELKISKPGQSLLVRFYDTGQ